MLQDLPSGVWQPVREPLTAEFRVSEKGSFCFNHLAMSCARAIFAESSSGICCDENYRRYYTTGSFLEAIKQQASEVELNIAFLKAGSEGLSLQEIHRMSPAWETPEQLAAKGCASGYLRVPEVSEIRYKQRFGLRNQELKGLQALGYTL